jgi:hypothetical protein
MTLGWGAEAEVDAAVVDVEAVGMVVVGEVDGWRNVGNTG